MGPSFFISDERQGVAPRKATDILQAGDQIWVWQDEHSDQLRLAQIPDANAAFVALNPKMVLFRPWLVVSALRSVNLTVLIRLADKLVPTLSHLSIQRH